MPRYYVNMNAQPTGEHEVHVWGCTVGPNAYNQRELGTFLSCTSAVEEAKRLGYRTADGCKVCSEPCHTR
jgi:hypothetical protein